MFVVGLALTWGDPSSETAPAETFSYWHDNRGRHQISGLLLAPLIAFLLVFFGAGLQRGLRGDSADSGHGAVAFGGALLAAAAFALVGMLEGAATNAAHEGQRQAVYTLSQLHSCDWPPGTQPSQLSCSRQASARGSAECCQLRSCGPRSSSEHHSSPAWILRVLPRPALADRGWAHVHVAAPPRSGRGNCSARDLNCRRHGVLGLSTGTDPEP